MKHRLNASQYPIHRINGRQINRFLDLVPLHAESFLVRRDESTGRVVRVIAKLRSQNDHGEHARALRLGEFRFEFMHNGETGEYAAKRLHLADRELAVRIIKEANELLNGTMDTFFRALANHEVSNHGKPGNRTDRFIHPRKHETATPAEIGGI